MYEVPPEEIDSPFSIDPNGKIFWWKGQPYRAITEQRASLYRSLFERGIVQNAIDKGWLIQTEMTDLHLDEYSMVLKHRLIPFISYPHEWCAPMLKDAALLVIDLQIELRKHNLSLQDAHPWNVLFDGARPVFVDFSSIFPVEDNQAWVGKDEFIQTYIYPLRLMANGQYAAARWYLDGIGQGVSGNDMAMLTNRFSPQELMLRRLRTLYQAAKKRVPQSIRKTLNPSLSAAATTAAQVSATATGSHLQELHQLRTEVEKISLPFAKTEWADYNEAHFPSFTDQSDWRQKEITVHQVLSRLKPETVLDMGSNRGWFSQLAATMGSTVVAFDVDTTGVARMYEDVKQRGLSVLPLLMDFRYPTPSTGLCYQWRTAATERLKCDLVMGIALTHHLVFKQKLSFEQIADGMKIYAKRWVLVEFIPREDQYVSKWWTPEQYSWYTPENFRKALEKRFSSVEMFPSSPEPRIQFLCEV